MLQQPAQQPVRSYQRTRHVACEDALAWDEARMVREPERGAELRYGGGACPGAAFGTFVRRGRSSMVTLDCDGAPTEQSHQRIRVVTG